MAKGKKKSAKKSAKPAKAAKKVTKKAAAKKPAKRGKKAAKKAAPAAAGKKAKKAKKSSKKARATGKSKQTSSEETPAPVVDALSFNTLVGRGSSSPQPSSSGIGEGSKAPAFELSDQDGSPVSSRDLAGKPYVLYFYPKDDTPGCTIEACDFGDSSSNFGKAGVRVIGVSPDSVQSHDKFRSKFKLNFTLLADPEKKLAKGYGVWAKKQNYGREYMGIVRSTFLVDEKGVVRKAWRGIKAAGHVEKVLGEVRAAP